MLRVGTVILTPTSCRQSVRPPDSGIAEPDHTHTLQTIRYIVGTTPIFIHLPSPRTLNTCPLLSRRESLESVPTVLLQTASNLLVFVFNSQRSFIIHTAEKYVSFLGSGALLCLPIVLSAMSHTFPNWIPSALALPPTKYGEAILNTYATTIVMNGSVITFLLDEAIATY